MRTIGQCCSAFCLWLDEKKIRIEPEQCPFNKHGPKIEGASSGSPQPWLSTLKEIERKHPIKEE